VRLLLLAPNELTRDPRARRAAAAAVARGFDVVGVSGSGDEPVPLEGVEVVRVGGGRVSAGLRRAGLGGMRPSPPLVRELRGLFRIARLAGANLRLARAAAALAVLDVVHANDFDTLPAGWLVARRRGVRLVYDAHEVYADQEPGTPLVYRGLVRLLEGPLARRADAVVTVSEPIADELERTLRLASRPLVALNCPPRVEVEPAPRGDGPLRAIYQGAMGPGRLLEDLLVAAEHAPEVELTLRVAGADPAALRAATRHLPNVVVAEPAPPDRLVEALAGFHVGLIINRPLTRNDELVFPNKLFEYLMAGLAVAVPRLPGMTPLVEGENVGLTYEPSRPEELGRALATLGDDRARLEGMRRRARELALARYHAETQAEQLARAWRLP
jgi:glycogen synthase